MGDPRRRSPLRRPEQRRAAQVGLPPSSRPRRRGGSEAVAFPSISTGVYGYPGGLAAQLSVEAITTADTDVETILLVAYSDHMAAMWRSCLDAADLP